eukprot:2651322-Pyramimonas_sp.AAC.1
MKESAILCGMGVDAPPTHVMIESLSQGTLRFPVVDEAVVLGTRFDREGGTTISFSHRFLKAEGNLGKITPHLLNPRASWEAKARAFSRGPVASALYDCQAWIPTQARLQQLRAWEDNVLRKSFKLKHLPQEGHLGYNSRTARLLEGRFA